MGRERWLLQDGCEGLVTGICEKRTEQPDKVDENVLQEYLYESVFAVDNGLNR